MGNKAKTIKITFTEYMAITFVVGFCQGEHEYLKKLGVKQSTINDLIKKGLLRENIKNSMTWYKFTRKKFSIDESTLPELSKSEMRK